MPELVLDEVLLACAMVVPTALTTLIFALKRKTWRLRTAGLTLLLSPPLFLGCAMAARYLQKANVEGRYGVFYAANTSLAPIDQGCLPQNATDITLAIRHDGYASRFTLPEPELMVWMTKHLVRRPEDRDNPTPEPLALLVSATDSRKEALVERVFYPDRPADLVLYEEGFGYLYPDVACVWYSPARQQAVTYYGMGDSATPGDPATAGAWFDPLIRSNGDGFVRRTGSLTLLLVLFIWTLNLTALAMMYLAVVEQRIAEAPSPFDPPAPA